MRFEKTAKALREVSRRWDGFAHFKFPDEAVEAHFMEVLESVYAAGIEKGMKKSDSIGNTKDYRGNHARRNCI
jgi:hypothetical protein